MRGAGGIFHGNRAGCGSPLMAGFSKYLVCKTIIKGSQMSGKLRINFGRRGLQIDLIVTIPKHSMWESQHQLFLPNQMFRFMTSMLLIFIFFLEKWSRQKSSCPPSRVP